jgi:hypothetical protein
MNGSRLASLAVALVAAGLMTACQRTDTATPAGTTSGAGTSTAPGAPASAASAR